MIFCISPVGETLRMYVAIQRYNCSTLSRLVTLKRSFTPRACRRWRRKNEVTHVL